MHPKGLSKPTQLQTQKPSPNFREGLDSLHIIHMQFSTYYNEGKLINGAHVLPPREYLETTAAFDAGVV